MTNIQLVVLGGTVHAHNGKQFVALRGQNLQATLRNEYDRVQFENRGRSGYIDYIRRAAKREVEESEE